MSDSELIRRMGQNLDSSNYTDEELLEHINLEEPYTETELTEKLKTITDMFGSSTNPSVENILQFYNDVEERLKARIEPEEEEEEEQEIPKIKITTIKKRHTLIINSDKRTDRTQSTTSFSWELEDEIPNVKSLTIESYNIPKSWYNISNAIGNNIFGISFIQPKTVDFTVRDATDLYSLFNAKSPIDTSNNTFDNWINRSDCTTKSLGAGLLRDTNGKPKTAFGDYWEDISWNVTYNTSSSAFEITVRHEDTLNKLDISYIPMRPGSKYDYILIRDISSSDGINDTITSTNMRELGEKNLYFLIRQEGIEEIKQNAGDISSSIVTFLNSRQPIDFSAVNTDIYSRANLDVTHSYDYNLFINSVENQIENYTPSNKIKQKTYDIWASFKEVNFNDSDNLNITTNLLESEIQELYTDISDVSWNITDNGISTGEITTESGVFYDLTSEIMDVNRIRIKFIPKDDSKKLERKFYFRIKEGHYGSVNSLLNAINQVAPKKHFDNRDISGSISLKDFLIDTNLDGTTSSTHDLITKAYNNDFGTSFINSIDWKFERDDQTEHVVLTELSSDDNTTDVSFILYDENFTDVINGTTTCGVKRPTGLNNKNTLGTLLGYISDPDLQEYIVTDTYNSLAKNSPDLRRVRNVNIMLVDYKAYAYVPNANQINPAPKNKALKTPFYLSEVVFDPCDSQPTSTQQEFQTQTLNTIQNLRGGGRNLTENQIYSLNAIFDSQAAVQENNDKQLNYMYKDYFLYGIHVRDKPELGSSSNEGILSVYDSKKGKREYIDPTRLTKFYIELVDQNFDVIDLNGIDIELTLNIETQVSVKK